MNNLDHVEKHFLSTTVLVFEELLFRVSPGNVSPDQFFERRGFFD